MDFGLGLLNGWIYVLIFGLINLILMKIYPRHYTKRLFTLPTFTNARGKIISVVYAVMLNITMIATCLLPINSGMLFAVGTTVYIASIICVIAALYVYGQNVPSKPVTKGIYKISRHPQQVFTCFMFIGIGILLANIFICVSGLLQLILLYPSMLAQEKFCIEKYGEDYEKYLLATPRYFLLF